MCEDGTAHSGHISSDHSLISHVTPRQAITQAHFIYISYILKHGIFNRPFLFLT